MLLGGRRTVRKDELLAADIIQFVEDPISIEPLDVTHERRTPDWRATLADGRLADIEVTQHTASGLKSFWSQINKKPGPKWPTPELTHAWTALVSGTAGRKPNVGRTVRRIIPVLAAAEDNKKTPDEMYRVASEGLKQLQQSQNEPAILRVRLTALPSPVPDGAGCVYTLGSVAREGAWDDFEALLSAIQECVDRKTEDNQLANAPGLKWLFVLIADGNAVWQLNDHFGPFSTPPYPFQVFEAVRSDYFDEVWVATPAEPVATYTVVRLSSPPIRQIVPAIRF